MRIRAIKPEFWSSEDVAALDWPTRLLFIGLWSYVDDNGVGRDNEKLIKADLFPLEDDPRDTLATVSRGLQALCDGGQIARYIVDGRPFLYVNAWEDHQRIDRPNKPRYPLPTCGNAVARDTLATPSRQSRETPATGTGEQGNRGTGEQTRPPASPPDTFVAWWSAYPRKEGKGLAVKAYRAAIKTIAPDELLTLTAQWFTDRPEIERKFTPLPASWLNAQRWADERPAEALAPSQSPWDRATATGGDR